MNLNSINLTNSKLFYGENGESFVTNELNFQNIKSEYAVKKVSYPLFDSYNISNIYIDKITASNSGLTEYSSLLRVDTAKIINIKNISLQSNNISIVPFLEFVNIDNLILDNLDAKNFNTTEPSNKQAILIQDSVNVNVN